MSAVVALIQARVNSLRLPRKSLAVIGSRASVFHVWKRASAACLVHVIVPRDDAAEFRALLPGGVVISGGAENENDVLSRMMVTTEGWLWGEVQRLEGNRGTFWDNDVRLVRYNEPCKPGIIVVRLTADCPFVDPAGIQAVVRAVEDGADFAYLDPIPNGLDAEAFTVDLLMRAHEEATDPADREHVTSWMKRNARNVVALPMYADLPRYRWTLDDETDYAWFHEVAREIDCNPPHPTLSELLALLERRPDLVRLDNNPTCAAETPGLCVGSVSSKPS